MPHKQLGKDFKMTGTLINTAAIFIGGFIGLLVKKGIQAQIQESIMKVQGIVVMIIGLNGVLESMITVDSSGKLHSQGTVLLLASLVIGTIIGESLKIETRINNIGGKLESKFGLSGATKGFIDCSLLFCIGAMSILGPINDGLYGDSSILLIKSAIDGISSVFFASSLGIGVLFSGISVLIYQGTISLAACAMAPLISDTLLTSFSTVGYAILLCIGLNFIGKSNIRTTNAIPALLIPIIYALIV